MSARTVRSSTPADDGSGLEGSGLEDTDPSESDLVELGSDESDLVELGSDEPDLDESVEAAPAARRGTGPGVVVVHDWYGPLPHVAAFADELTMAGFDVELVDLYDGVTTHDPGRAEVLAESLDGSVALEQIAAAVERLRVGGAPSVGAVGFSLGGSLVLRAAAGCAMDAVVIYYATCDPRAVAGLTCPVQLHLAEDDEFEPDEDVEEFVAVLRTGGAPVDTFAYPGTPHSFANADVELADLHAADVALARTVGFLQARLVG